MDSDQEAVSPTRTNCFSSRPSGDTSVSSAPSESQHAYYSSPAVDRHRPAFTIPPKTFSSHASHRQLPPRQEISLPHLTEAEYLNTSTSSRSSDLGTQLTSPSSSVSASPGPIVFASPPSSNFQFQMRFSSAEILAPMTSEEVPIVPSDSSLLSMPADVHAPNMRALRLLDRTNTDSTVQTAWTSQSNRDELPLSRTGVRPRVPWREFAREHSKEQPTLRENQAESSRNYSRASSGASYSSSRRVLSSILTTAPPSRSHTLSLPLTRPRHHRTMSSGSQLAPMNSMIRSNSSRSSPRLASRRSFPSRPPSPMQVSMPVPSKRQRTRSNSLSLFRRVSNRSGARFSRSDYTGDISIDAADYAAAQCEAFVTEVEPVSVHGPTSTDILVQQLSITADAPRQTTTTITAGVQHEKVHRSILGMLKNVTSKLRGIIRRSSESRSRGMQVQVEVTNSEEITASKRIFSFLSALTGLGYPGTKY